MSPSNYDTNVFINCPFDEDYSNLFDAALFSIYCCGFRPRCSLEVENAGEVRIEKIKKIISECRIGIHDISRTELDKNHKLPRFNMPLELGLFIGATKFGGRKQKSKIIMIFDKEDYRYQKYISDIAGQDIASHNSNPETFIKKIRNNLNNSKINGWIMSHQDIIDKYNSFQSHLPNILNNLRLNKDDVTYTDTTQIIEQWLKLNG